MLKRTKGASMNTGFLRLSSSVTGLVVCAGLMGCDQSQTAKAPEPPPPVGIARLVSVATNDIAKTPELLDIAMMEGKTLYDMHCASCHGADLKGVKDQHTPDLTDNDWMYVGDDPDSGGVIHTAADVEKTILNGIRAMPKVTNLGSQQENDT